jgi:hypothetical protein
MKPMRVRQLNPDVLIAEDLSVGPRLIGVALVALGVAAVYLPAAGAIPGDAHAAWLAAVLAIVGVGVFRAAGSRSVMFDRAAGLVRVHIRALLGTSAFVYRLPEIADAIIELQPAGDGRSVYTAAFVMRDGTHRAWATYATGYPANEVPVVQAVRQFLGTAVSPVAPDGTPAIPGRQDSARLPAG